MYIQGYSDPLLPEELVLLFGRTSTVGPLYHQLLISQGSAKARRHFEMSECTQDLRQGATNGKRYHIGVGLSRVLRVRLRQLLI